MHYHSYCQRVQRDQRKLEKGWEIAQNENLNLASYIPIALIETASDYFLAFGALSFGHRALAALEIPALAAALSRPFFSGAGF